MIVHFFAECGRQATKAGDVILGVGLAIAKVFLSCYVAVLNQRAFRADKNPFLVQFSSLKVSSALTSLGYMIVKDGIFGDGTMWGEWSQRTVILVLCGFVLKTLFNHYLLKFFVIWQHYFWGNCVGNVQRRADFCRFFLTPLVAPSEGLVT